MNKIKVFIVDDHALVRDGIISMLNNVNDIQVVGEASEGYEALEKLHNKNVDVVIMDVIMPGISGIEVTKTIKQKYPNLKVLFLSMEVSEQHVTDAIKVGGNGYLLKDSRRTILLEAIREIQKNNQYFSNSISEMIFKNFLKRSTPSQSENELDAKELTAREIEILTFLCKGLSHKDIGEKLFISPRTVDTHRTNIIKKLQVNSTAELVIKAIKKKLVVLD
jgi:DNA-binding NarL/FixJ family response regulator